MGFNTEQEKFWAGEFGDEYFERNQGQEILARNLSFFSKSLKNIQKINSCIEFGANIGMNLKALKILFPLLNIKAIEINIKACLKLENLIGKKNVFQKSILDFQIKEKFDLVLIKTVLIHINPDRLEDVYRKLYSSSKKYILIAEYYNFYPVSIDYRGNKDKLFKRDFAGEMLDMFSDLKLVDYGFIYYRDNNFPQDDRNWFLLEKK